MSFGLGPRSWHGPNVALYLSVWCILLHPSFGLGCCCDLVVGYIRFISMVASDQQRQRACLIWAYGVAHSTSLQDYSRHCPNGCLDLRWSVKCLVGDWLGGSLLLNRGRFGFVANWNYFCVLSWRRNRHHYWRFEDWLHVEGICRNDDGGLDSLELRDANTWVAIAWDRVFLQQVLFGYADGCFCSRAYLSVYFHFLAFVVFTFFIFVDFCFLFFLLNDIN